MMFDVVFVLLLLPLLDRVIYPRLDRAGYSPSLRLRILIGMLFAVAAMGVAGVVEHFRLWTIWSNPDNPQIHDQVIGEVLVSSSSILMWPDFFHGWISQALLCCCQRALLVCLQYFQPDFINYWEKFPIVICSHWFDEYITTGTSLWFDFANIVNMYSSSFLSFLLPTQQFSKIEPSLWVALSLVNWLPLGPTLLPRGPLWLFLCSPFHFSRAWIGSAPEW